MGYGRLRRGRDGRAVYVYVVGVIVLVGVVDSEFGDVVREGCG